MRQVKGVNEGVGASWGSELVGFVPNFERMCAQEDWASAWQLALNWTHARISDEARASIWVGAARCSAQLGVQERMLAELEQAMVCVRFFPTAVLMLAGFWTQTGQVGQAVSLLEAALQVHTEHLGLANQLAVLYLDAGRAQEVCALLQPWVPRGVFNAHTLTLLGVAHAMLSLYEQALGYFERMQAFDETCLNADYFNNLGMITKELNQFERSVAYFKEALAINPRHAALNNVLLVLNYVAPPQPDVYLTYARHFGQVVSEGVVPFSEFSGSLVADRPLRIGFVSGDLHSHPVGFFFVNVVRALRAVAGDGVWLGGYMNRTIVDETSEEIRAQCDVWRVFSKESHAQVAQCIHADGVDVLFDLSGHTGFSRLACFAYRPAPIQVSWLGYFASTGLAQMDYFLADPLTLPPEFECQFTEQVWRLPNTRLCFSPPKSAPEINRLPALDQGFVTLGCTNALIKLNDGLLEVWANILKALPTARLLIKAKELGHPPSVARLLAQFEGLGVNSDRLILEGPSSREAYFEVYHKIDFLLDPFPFPGGTTTAEALWMGVPVLSMTGVTFLSRQGAGLLINAGLADWVAKDVSEYVALAQHKAQNLEALAQLRSGLRAQLVSCPIFDAQSFAGDFLAAVRGMWQRHVALRVGSSVEG